MNDDSNVSFITKYLGNKALNVAKFVKRNGDKKQALNRYERYEFYQSLLDDVGEIDLKAYRKPKNEDLPPSEYLIKKIKWLRQQVFKTLHILKEVFGQETFDFLMNICISSCSMKLTRKDKIIIEDIQKYLDQLSHLSEIDLLNKFIGFT